MRVLRAAAVGMVLLAFITVGPTPSSAELKVNLGGYIKLDTEYQSNITNEGKFRVDPGPASVAFTEGPNKDRVKARNDEFLMEARESRFHLSITDEVGATKLKGFIQGDFFGGRDDDSNSLVSNSSLFRLRHAWASGETQFGPGSLTVLAGQTWSAFMNIDVAAWDLVDFNGPAGQLFARQPQLRLTYAIPYGKGTSLNIIGAVQAQSVNFETTDLNAVPLTKSSLTAAGVSPARQEGENVPAFVGKLQWISEYLKAEAGAIYSKAKGIAPNGKRQEANAYGLQASVTVPLGPFSINLHWDWLSGMNREANGDYADAVFVVRPGNKRDVGVITTTGGWGSLSYKLTPSTTVSGYYGIRTAEPSGFSGFGRGVNAFGDLVREQSIHVTLLQQFWKRFQFGAEYERQWVDAFRQNSGTQNIYHLAVWMFF